MNIIKKQMIKKILKNILQYFLAVIISLAIALMLRVFAVDFYSIPSDSMRPALEPGDFIMVNKLCYGARMYRNFDFLEDGTEPQTYRVKGYSNVEHNDVIVFNYPYLKKRDSIKMNLSVFYVKRCIALPGDTLKAVNGYYEVNGKQGFGNIEGQKTLSSLEGFEGIYRYTISPTNKAYQWDVKDFGPILIPAKGSSIEITADILGLYMRQIVYETKGVIRIDEGQVYLNDQLLTRYTFTRNWYFMAGDNVLNSQDSRYIGFVPEEFLVGKVARILTAKDKESGKYRWSRFFKKVE